VSHLYTSADNPKGGTTPLGPIPSPRVVEAWHIKPKPSHPSATLLYGAKPISQSSLINNWLLGVLLHKTVGGRFSAGRGNYGNLGKRFYKLAFDHQKQKI
jgi:hypothetical protein